MGTRRIVGTLVAIAVATSGMVAVGTQRSAASIIASVTITSPEAGSTVYGDVNVQAQAYGQMVDPPQKIKFFVDHHKKPAATVDCLINLAYPSAYCGGQWLWHASRLVGHHSLSAEVVLLDGALSGRSQAVHVVVQAQTLLTVHHAKHVVAGHRLVVSGRVRSTSHGRPGARHLPITITTAPTVGTARTIHLHTNKHGYYRTKFRAVANTTITVQPATTRRFAQSPANSYVQAVQGRPRCGLSSTHARVKQQVILRCRLSHLPAYSKFVIQNRIHGKWRRGRAFQSRHPNHTRLFISGLKRRTLVMREVFPPSSIYARSKSNAVKLHVT